VLEVQEPVLQHLWRRSHWGAEALALRWVPEGEGGCVVAGDWLKMDSSTPEKPEVLAITTRMGWDDPDLTVGKLFRVWRWFDQHTTDGNAPRVTAALLDRIAGVTGFADAMAAERWLDVSDAGVSLPKFDRHNGATAKARAQTAKRVANHRGNAEPNAEGNGASVTQALAREEKRREEQEKEDPPAARGPRATRKCPESFSVTADLIDWAAQEVPGVPIETETAKLRDHTFKTAISDWPGAWRNWMRNAKKFMSPQGNQNAGPRANSKHTGFQAKNYREGVTEDGSLV
jgi:hypothetical protein